MTIPGLLQVHRIPCRQDMGLLGNVQQMAASRGRRPLGLLLSRLACRRLCWIDTISHQLRLSRCPGVFKTAQTGCGAPLRPWARSVTLEDGWAHVFEFWACEGAGCDFWEVLPSRLKTPQLALEAVSAAEGFQVRATTWCHPCTIEAWI